MSAAGRGRALAVVFVGALVLVGIAGFGMLQATSRLLRPGTPSVPVDVVVTLTVRPDRLQVRVTATGDGLRDANIAPSLTPVDDGRIVASAEPAESPTGQRLTYSRVESNLAADGRSVTISYEVQGRTAYPLPLGPSLAAQSLSVSVDGGRVTSCSTDAGTDVGTPKLSPCRRSSNDPLLLRPDGNGLSRVRITVAPA